jgi:hypothetical protein
MKLFSNEKDTILKIVNSILIIWLIIAVVITFGIGIKIINKEEVLTYDDYSKQICTLDQIPTEEVDQDLTKSNCYSHYIEEKSNIESTNKANKENVLIALGNVIIVSLFLHLLNKKYK